MFYGHNVDETVLEIAEGVCCLRPPPLSLFYTLFPPAVLSSWQRWLFQTFSVFATSSGLQGLQIEMSESRAQAAETYEDLAQAYGELKIAWNSRGPRDEDVARMDELQGILNDRDARLASVEARMNDLKKVRLHWDTPAWCSALHSLRFTYLMNTKSIHQCEPSDQKLSFRRVHLPFWQNTGAVLQQD